MNKLKLKMSSGRNTAPEKLDPSIIAVREKVLALLAMNLWDQQWPQYRIF